MAILGLGIDIVAIARIKIIVMRSNNKLAQRILHPLELKSYLQHQQAVRFLAKRFAVKEAAMKALGMGMHNGLRFNQFEVFNDKLGKPFLRLHQRAKELMAEFGMASLHVSLSDEEHYACATVIIEGYV